MEQFQALNLTVIGESHIRNRTHCEDASFSMEGEGFRIAAVADGHGDPACARSNVGSRFAVECAEDNLRSFAETYILEKNHGREVDRELLSSAQQPVMMRRLIGSILRQWREKVQRDLSLNPVTEEELSGSGNWADLYREGKELLHLYGTTLIAALQVDGLLLLLQQGDGRCVVIRSDTSVEEPIPWDKNCEGNVTTSLCQADAQEAFRYRVLEVSPDGVSPVAACVLVTDGVEDSFAEMEGAYDRIGGIVSVLSGTEEAGKELSENWLKDTLSNLTKYGSQDDISFSALLCSERIRKIAEILQLKWEEYSSLQEERTARAELNGMLRKKEYLQKNAELAREAYRQAEESIKNAKTRKDQLFFEYEQLQLRLVENGPLDKIRIETRQKMEAAEKERDVFLEQYDRMKQRADDAASGARTCRLRLEMLGAETGLSPRIGNSEAVVSQKNPEGEQNPDTEKTVLYPWNKPEEKKSQRWEIHIQ